MTNRQPEDAPAQAADATAALPTVDAPAIDAPAAVTIAPVSSGTSVPAPAVVGPRRRTKVLGVLLRSLRFAFAAGLFAGGMALGVLMFQRLAPAPVPVGDVVTGGVVAPPVVQELVLALESNDADALRSAVSAEPYRQIAAEMQSWNLKEVKSVETLATMQDGPRSATEIVIVGRTTELSPVIFNLVVHVADGTIMTFR